MAGKKTPNLPQAEPNTIYITLNNGEQVEMYHSNPKTAQMMYENYRIAAKYAGQWIKHISLDQ